MKSTALGPEPENPPKKKKSQAQTLVHTQVVGHPLRSRRFAAAGLQGLGDVGEDFHIRARSRWGFPKMGTYPK